MTATSDTGPVFRKFTIERGETAFDAIERLCRIRGLLPVSDGVGNVSIGLAARSRAMTRLARGSNILSASGVADISERFSTYEILGQQAGDDDVFAGDAKISRRFLVNRPTRACRGTAHWFYSQSRD